MYYKVRFFFLRFVFSFISILMYKQNGMVIYILQWWKGRGGSVIIIKYVVIKMYRICKGFVRE